MLFSDFCMSFRFVSLLPPSIHGYSMSFISLFSISNKIDFDLWCSAHSFRFQLSPSDEYIEIERQRWQRNRNRQKKKNIKTTMRKRINPIDGDQLFLFSSFFFVKFISYFTVVSVTFPSTRKREMESCASGRSMWPCNSFSKFIVNSSTQTSNRAKKKTTAFIEQFSIAYSFVYILFFHFLSFCTKVPNKRAHTEWKRETAKEKKKCHEWKMCLHVRARFTFSVVPELSGWIDESNEEEEGEGDDEKT